MSRKHWHLIIWLLVLILFDNGISRQTKENEEIHGMDFTVTKNWASFTEKRALSEESHTQYFLPLHLLNRWFLCSIRQNLLLAFC